MKIENVPAPSTSINANPHSESNWDKRWHKDAQTFFSFLPNSPLRDSLTRRLKEVYSARHDLEGPLSEAKKRSCIKTQVQECGAILEGLLNNRLDQDFGKEILERYGNNRICRVL